MYYSNQYMNQAKRQLSVDMSWEDDTKKLRTSDTNELITCMEDLSNEVLYEIFDYLNAGEIFNQFLNLNQRFENLVLHSNLPLQVHYSSTPSKQSFELFCLRMIIPNTHRILSFHLCDRLELIKFFTLSTIDSSFYRLESLILHGMKSKEIVSFLPSLTILPRLFSLKISLDRTLDDSNEIYRLIFRLPMLKYNKLSATQLVIQDLISITANEQFSSIEHLVIDHPCPLHILYDILSYTPNLRRLTCENLFQLNQNIPTEISLKLFNLTHCIIHICYLKFNELEIFIKKLSSQLRVLHFTHGLDIAYLDADRWERLISQHMPNLHTFQFKYSDAVRGRVEYQSYHGFIQRFTSPFWIEKGWIFKIQTVVIHWPPIEIIYSIQPHKKQWYDQLNNERKILQFIEQESMDISKSMVELIVQGCHFQKYDQWFINYIQFISSLVKITCLHLEFSSFSTDTLAQFFHLIPNLDSLTIVFTSLNQIKPPTQKQIDVTSKITKVNLEQMVDLNRIYILINLCPQMECLQVKCRNYSDLESMLRLILMKRKSPLSSLSFGIAGANDSMVKNLQTIIDFEKLLVNYTIQHIDDRIVLHWQRH